MLQNNPTVPPFSHDRHIKKGRSYHRRWGKTGPVLVTRAGSITNLHRWGKSGIYKSFVSAQAAPPHGRYLGGGRGHTFTPSACALWIRHPPPPVKTELPPYFCTSNTQHKEALKGVPSSLQLIYFFLCLAVPGLSFGTARSRSQAPWIGSTGSQPTAQHAKSPQGYFLNDLDSH